MREIAINELGDLSELNTFISQTNEKATSIKGIVVATDDDIRSISKDIKELKQREDVLKIAEERLIKLAGIDRVGITIENSRQQRLLANKNVQNAKQKIKDDAINYFVKNATELIQNSKASDAYKQNFIISEMARDTIAGKSKDFIGLMKTELGNLGLRLDNNARETSEKQAIISKYSDDLVRDLENLLNMPVENLKLALINRQLTKDNEVKKLAKVEAERLAKIEAERLAKIEAERLKIEAENERIAKEVEAERLAKIEAERLAWRLDAERLEAEQLAKIEAQRMEAEQLAKIEAQRMEAEQLAKIERAEQAIEDANINADKKIEAYKIEAERAENRLDDFDDGIQFDTIGAIKNARLTLSSIPEKIEGIDEIIRKLAVIEREIK